MGGTRLWIKGIRFSSMAAASNLVMIGPNFGCEIVGNIISLSFLKFYLEMHTTPNMVVCDTLPGIEGTYELSVVADGRSFSSCSSPQGCHFTYTQYSTPTLQAIIPSASNIRTNISFWGVTEVTNTSSIEMFFEDWRCNMLDQESLQFNTGDLLFSTCEVGDVPAGKYPARFHNLINAGNSITYPGAVYYDENWNNFSFIIAPSVTSLSSNLGSKNGQIITITGTGFGNNASNISVNLDSLPCKILSINAGSSIICELSPDTRTSSSDPHIGFSGMESRIWEPAQDLSKIRTSNNYPNNSKYVASILASESAPYK